MRGLFWFLALAALAVTLSLVAGFNDGYMLVVLPPWRVELSLNLALGVLFGIFLLLNLLARAVALTLSLPERVRDFRDRQQRQKASAMFRDAVRLLFEGRFGHALKKAAEAHDAGEAPGLSALIAARAAQRLREPAKQQEWLTRAAGAGGSAEAARLMLEAEMCIEERRFEDAVGVLTRLQQTSGRHIAALRLELRARQGCGDWDEVLRIVRRLEKSGALVAGAAHEAKLRAHRENILRLASDPSGLGGYIDRLPADEMDGRLALAAAEALFAQGEHARLRRLIERQLERAWDSALVELYGREGGGDEDDASARIARAEDWLRQQPQDAALLVALGRLCMRLRLWGKAQSYLEASLSVAGSRDAHIELARLADALGRGDEANRHYRIAAGA